MEAVFLTISFSRSVSGEISIDQNRQYNCCTMYKQTWGHKIKQALYSNMETMDFSHSKPFISESNSHSGSTEHLSRSVEQTQNQSNRMVSEYNANSESFSNLGMSSDISVCFSRQSSGIRLQYFAHGFQPIKHLRQMF